MRYFISLLTLCGALPLAAQEPVRVWVNTGSGVYHCPGTPAFANTRRGEYVNEDEARRRGFRANGDRICSTPGALDRNEPTPSLPDVPPAAPADSMTACVLMHVADGDTLACEGVGQVRLIGIDTPERAQQPFYSSATAALASLLRIGDTIRLQPDVNAQDQYRRRLAYVWYEGRMVNWLLVRHGWAVSYRFSPNLRYADEFDAAERRAQHERRGLWHIDGFRCRPEQYRKQACPQ